MKYFSGRDLCIKGGRFVLLIAISFQLSLQAFEFKQEKTSKYLRWQLQVNKDQLIISKNNDLVLIETFDLKIYEDLVKTLESKELEKNYFKSLKFTKEYFPDRAAQIQVTLRDNSVELFKFFKPEEQLLVMDFWINPEVKPVENQNDENTKPKVVVEEPKEIAPIVKEEKSFIPQASIDKVSNWNSSEQNSKNPYKDFRYGATVMWRYPAIVPVHEADIQLGAKIPEDYFAIKTPNSVKDERESTLQLIINFYKKEKYGLMKKTIDLFGKKYEISDQEKVLILYLEANTLLKSAIGNSSVSLIQGGISRLEEILRLSKDYNYQKVALRFLIQYSVNKENYQKTLEYSKDFFIKANENRDKEMIYLSTKTILFSLAQLNQTEKLDQFIHEEQVSQWLDTQEGLSYKYYTLYKREDYQKLLSSFERMEKSLNKPIDSSILYHVAESYFQLGELSKAKKYIDYYLQENSFQSYASYIRIRKALISELMEDPIHITLGYYLEAIDKATLPQARLEAKIRYVGIAYNRKQNVTEGDKSILGFLESKEDEQPWIQGDCQLLLWQTRLRTFIKSQSYNDALTYYSSLPVSEMAQVYRRVFEADGTEIVLGLIQQAYLKGDDSKVVKLWGIYQDKMGQNLQNNKQALFYAGSSAMRLGLKENSEKLLKSYKIANKETYPQWVKRDFSDVESDAVLVRQHVASKNWNGLNEVLKEVKGKNAVYVWGKAHMLVDSEKYAEAKTEIEEALVSKEIMKTMLPGDLSDMLELYLTAIEKVEKADRLQKRIEAVLAVMNQKNEVFKEVRERAKFLLLESYFQEKNKSYDEIKAILAEFQIQYENSTYLPRLKYVNALYLLGNKQIDEGTKLLNDLIKNKTTPTHIKEMAKSELNSLALP